MLSLFLDLFFKIFLFQVVSFIFCAILLFLLSSGWFVIAVCGSISVKGISWVLEELKTGVGSLSPMKSQLNGCLHFLCTRFVFYSFVFNNLIVTWRLCVICVGGDNDSNVLVMITQLIWITWTSMSDVRERPLNLITHSQTSKLWYLQYIMRSLIYLCDFDLCTLQCSCESLKLLLFNMVPQVLGKSLSSMIIFKKLEESLYFFVKSRCLDVKNDLWTNFWLSYIVWSVL